MPTWVSRLKGLGIAQEMKNQKTLVSSYCPHAGSAEANGLALVVIKDEGPNGSCPDLEKSYLENACFFQLRPKNGQLANCLGGHKTAIIVDSVSNEPANTTISITDLSALLQKATPLTIDSDHGFYLSKELRTLKKSGKLPERIIFFGAERGKLGAVFAEGSAVSDKLTQVRSTLSLLVSKVAETLKRNA